MSKSKNGHREQTSVIGIEAIQQKTQYSPSTLFGWRGTHDMFQGDISCEINAAQPHPTCRPEPLSSVACHLPTLTAFSQGASGPHVERRGLSWLEPSTSLLENPSPSLTCTHEPGGAAHRPSGPARLPALRHRVRREHVDAVLMQPAQPTFSSDPSPSRRLVLAREGGRLRAGSNQSLPCPCPRDSGGGG
jgi:hypothetical protein